MDGELMLDFVKENLKRIDKKSALAYIFLFSREKANDFSFSKEFERKVRFEKHKKKLKYASYFWEENWTKLIKLELEEQRKLIIYKEGNQYLKTLELFSNFSFVNQLMPIMRQIGFDKENIHSQLMKLMELMGQKKVKKNGYILILEFYVKLLQELQSYLFFFNYTFPKTKNKEGWIKRLKQQYKKNFLSFDVEKLKETLKEFKSLKTKKIKISNKVVTPYDKLPPVKKLFWRIDNEIRLMGSLLDIAYTSPLTLENTRLIRSYEPKEPFKRSVEQSKGLLGIKKAVELRQKRKSKA